MSYDDAARTRELLLTRIALYGYAMTLDVGSGQTPGVTYCYTVGLPLHIGCPELVVCGFGPRTVINVITAVVALLHETVVLDGRVAVPGRRAPVWITPVPEEAVGTHLSAAGWWRRQHHDGQPAAAKQVVISDPKGGFPWEPGCEPGYGRMQSLLIPEIAFRRPSHSRPGDERADRY